ncbi:GtrA family protein [Methylobacterium sp. E-045]|uniref:GtrA family protein n=1 Tax=Methylobacterium sp. E-045 TaxID=2836575 RepID=UPI001FB930E7|nr:GtrA family protein [Methylobacterium sp. E-045]MCJ2130582.1 GtrA family protein [Methylobacterium sp. E-045]
MSGRALSIRLARMVLVGGIATLLYAGLSLAGTTIAGLPIVLASPLSYGLASLWSYAGHRWLTFGDRQPAPRAALRFCCLTIAGYAAAAAIPAIVGGLFEGPPWLSILSVCIGIPAVNYVVLSRHIFSEGPPGSRHRVGHTG